MLIEKPPETCSSGHPFQPGTYQVGFHHCRCEGLSLGETGHRQYLCLTCGELLFPGWHRCDDDEEWRKHGAFTAVRLKCGADKQIRGGATWKY